MTRFDIAFKPFGKVKRGFFGTKDGYPEPVTVTVFADNYFISDQDSHGYTRLVLYRYEDGGGKNHVFLANGQDVLYVKPYKVDVDET